MAKKGKAEATAEIPPELVILPTEPRQEKSVPSAEPIYTPEEPGKDDYQFAENGNAVYDRPKSSPYATTPYTLLIGSSEVRYTILEEYLRVYPKWIEGCITDSSQPDQLPIIDLTADVHEDVGHTLVHYLYTGTYQTLRLPGISGIGQRLADYKRSVLAYCVARNHRLEGLEKLAKLHITTSGASLLFFDLLDITADIYGELPPGEQWFVTFLKGTIDAAFKSDRKLFTRDAFLNRIGSNRRFNLVLVNSIVRNLTDSSGPKAKRSRSISRDWYCGWIRTSDVPNTEVELVMPVAADGELTSADKEPRATRTEIDAAEVEPPFVEEEPVTPEAEQYSAQEEPVSAEEEPFVTERRSSSVEKRGRNSKSRMVLTNQRDAAPSLHLSEIISDAEKAFTELPEATLKENRTSTDDDWVPLNLSAKKDKPRLKKFKKTTKKQVVEDPVADLPAAPEAEPVPVIENNLLDFPAAPEIELGPVVESGVDLPEAPALTADVGFGCGGSNSGELWRGFSLGGTKAKKEKTLDWPTAPPPADTADWCWPAAVNSSEEPQVEDVPMPQKKGKKKSKEHPIPPLLTEEDALILQKKDKKKGKKVAVSSPFSYDLPEIRAFSNKNLQNEGSAFSDEHLQNEGYEFSIEHLQNEGWKQCNSCRALLQQLSLLHKQDETLNGNLG
ncbi:hypothetical protein MMC11_004115 [Xylographa trunciseda]|nr:hypothetical protein [Xylographa trunciseda]